MAGLAGALRIGFVPALANPFPSLLPPPNELRLTMREDPQSPLPLGPSCQGEAVQTLTCRAFVLTLENASPSPLPERAGAGCDSNHPPTIDCIAFHYAIYNRGGTAASYTTLSCSDSGIWPEYRTEDGSWKTVPQRDWICLRNITIETPLPPGGVVEGDFTLSSLAPGYDPAPLRIAGEHVLRFWFKTWACSASPDGSFCLARRTQQEPVVSPGVVVVTE